MEARMLAPPEMRTAPGGGPSLNLAQSDRLGGAINWGDKETGSLSQAHTRRFLTAAEELELAKRNARGDLAARNRLVTSHIPLVEKIAAPYRRPGVEWDDLVAEGQIGLFRAAETFDPEKGRFSTYATWWIKASVSEFTRRSRSVVKQGYRSCEADLSLNTPIHKHGGDEELVDRLPDKSHADPWQQISSQRNANELAELALSQLTERERVVFEARHLDDEPPTLHQLGDKLGVSRERVRQIEATAIRKARNAVEPALEALEQVERKGRWFNKSARKHRHDPDADRFLEEYYRYCTQRQRRKSRASK
jgi:RNA polymerase sigma-32 factor